MEYIVHANTLCIIIYIGYLFDKYHDICQEIHNIYSVFPGRKWAEDQQKFGTEILLFIKNFILFQDIKYIA